MERVNLMRDHTIDTLLKSKEFTQAFVEQCYGNQPVDEAQTSRTAKRGVADDDEESMANCTEYPAQRHG